mmetsp:Transcript_75135/g.220190  ORF Transcript_75135/g.220190 Transcript_75135/m.220190 type:complete len:204 (-) Transcript_75135:2597-3208(-)
MQRACSPSGNPRGAGCRGACSLLCLSTGSTSFPLPRSATDCQNLCLVASRRRLLLTTEGCRSQARQCRSAALQRRSHLTMVGTDSSSSQQQSILDAMNPDFAPGHTYHSHQCHHRWDRPHNSHHLGPSVRRGHQMRLQSTTSPLHRQVPQSPQDLGDHSPVVRCIGSHPMAAMLRHRILGHCSPSNVSSSYSHHPKRKEALVE